MANKTPLKRESGRTKQFGATDTINGGIIAANSIDKTSLKNFSAHTFLANNTSSAAAPAEHVLNYPGWQSVNSAWVTWTAGVAPSGTDVSVYNWSQIGNLVSGEIRLFRGTSGTTVTNVLVTWPTDLPVPTAPTGWTGASIHQVKVEGFTANAQNGITPYTSGVLRRNAADTAFEFNIPFASQTLRGVWIKFSYFVS